MQWLALRLQKHRFHRHSRACPDMLYISTRARLMLRRQIE
jgi:hypothetical protein